MRVIPRASARVAIFAIATAATVCLTMVGSASAAWFVEGAALTGSAALATTAKVDKPFVLEGGGLATECTGNLEAVSPEIGALNTLTASSLVFTGCKSNTANCTIPTTLGTVPITAEPGEGTGQTLKVLVKPSTGTNFITLKVTGSSCSVAGNRPITKDFEGLLPTGREERTIQLFEASQPASGLLKSASSSAAFTGSVLLKLANAKAFQLNGFLIPFPFSYLFPDTRPNTRSETLDLEFRWIEAFGMASPALGQAEVGNGERIAFKLVTGGDHCRGVRLVAGGRGCRVEVYFEPPEEGSFEGTVKTQGMPAGEATLVGATF